jgi:hypothetical protein|nr:MAG TPA: hypothetical protein [Bacteriophage sp.]
MEHFCKKEVKGNKRNFKGDENMYKVKYEKYYDYYINSQEVKTFYSLKELADWLFEMVNGEYNNSSFYFVNPDEKHEREDGRLYLDDSFIQSCDGTFHYWIEQIERDGEIIYSCGTFTNGICHWNEEIKQWLRECRERKNNPTFNFG